DPPRKVNPALEYCGDTGEIRIGENFTLTCYVMEADVTYFKWKFPIKESEEKHHYGDLIYENTSTVEMETTIAKQNVTISSASLKDTGIYECHAVVKDIASEPDKLQLNIL
ncbi:unnamed protein product, partial [Meganyctiphanes norvegica]